MTDPKSASPRGDRVAPTDLRLLKDPIGFIAEEHLRERQVCALIDSIATAPAAAVGDVTEVLDFLTDELPLHHEDEERDLFPLMRKRCQPEDEIDAVIDRLTSDHDHAATDTPKVVAALRAALDDPATLDASARASLAAFANHGRRHLIVENAIILPIARARLTETDKEQLCHHMLYRRGLDRLPTAGQAD